MVLWSNRTAEYPLGGCPVLTRYPPIGLDDVLAENPTVEAVEAFRWPARVP